MTHRRRLPATCSLGKSSTCRPRFAPITALSPRMPGAVLPSLVSDAPPQAAKNTVVHIAAGTPNRRAVPLVSLLGNRNIVFAPTSQVDRSVHSLSRVFVTAENVRLRRSGHDHACRADFTNKTSSIRASSSSCVECHVEISRFCKRRAEFVTARAVRVVARGNVTPRSA